MSLRTLLGAALGVAGDVSASKSDRLRAIRAVSALVSDEPLDEDLLAELLDAAERCAADELVGSRLKACVDQAVRAFGDLPPSEAIAARLGGHLAAPAAHGARPAQDVLRWHFRAICVATESSITLLGMPSGVLGIDVFVSGLRRGGLYVFVGADDLALDLALLVAANVAEDEERAAEGDVVVRSTAATAERLAMRIVSARARVAETKLWFGQMVSEEWSRITEAAFAVSRMPLFLADVGRGRMGASGADGRARPDVASLRLLVEDEPSPERLAELVAHAEGAAGGGAAILVSLRELPRDLASRADAVWALRPRGPGRAELRVIANRHGPKGRSLLVYDATSGAVSEPEVAEER